MSVLRNEIVYGKAFLSDVKELPPFCQEKLASLLEILREDPFAPQLHAKPLAPPLQGWYSFRITRDYRVVFEFPIPHTIHLLFAGHRKDIYKRLGRSR